MQPPALVMLCGENLEVLLCVSYIFLTTLVGELFLAGIR